MKNADSGKRVASKMKLGAGKSPLLARYLLRCFGCHALNQAPHALMSHYEISSHGYSYAVCSKPAWVAEVNI
ncbi:MAG: hypothetical protein Q8K52_02895 [Thiobacillus sp.]|nr:hypothetical protein [Thiobacillus sp.]